MNTPTHLLYLHGFRSSPQSFKAQMLASYVARHHPKLHWLCPALPAAPQEAIALLNVFTADWPTPSMAIVGSSLGGFYATVLAEQRGCRAVVLNPAVNPARDLEAHIGTHTSWHDPETQVDFRAEDVADLRAMTPPSLQRPQNYAAVIAQGDELLDWREMLARYEGAHIKRLDASDHALSDFDQHLPFVLNFLDL